MINSLPIPVLTFLEWLKKTEGRDKLYRLVCYASKIPIEHLQDKDLKDRIKKGASSIGLSRKLLRLFRSLQFLQDLLSINQNQDIVERVLNSVKSLSLCLWMVVDHLQWFEKAGYIRLTDIRRLSEIHSKAWFLGLLTGAASSIYKFQVKNKTDIKTKKAITKNLVDLVIPAQRLGWLPVSDSVVGCCGTFTSIMGIIDTWPKAASSPGNKRA